MGKKVGEVRERKPTGAFAISFIAGFLIFGTGLLLFGAGMAESFVFFQWIYTLMALGSFLIGILIMVLASILYVKPEHHAIFGVVIIIFSIISIVGLGGLIIGLILGIIGGALAIRWSPVPKPSPIPPVVAPRIESKGEREVIKEREIIREIVKIRCPYCKKLYDVSYDECPHCGGSK